MSFFGDLIARMRAGDQAPQGQYGLMQQVMNQPQHDNYGALVQNMPQGMAGGLMQRAAEKLQSQLAPQDQGGLMQQITQGAQAGGFGAAQPQSMGDMMSQMRGSANGFGGQQAPGNWMSQLQGTGFGAASPGGRFQQFRQLYGRDPMNQQELAMRGY